jgi:cysteine desulfurase
MKRIYLDHAATTPIDKKVAKAMWDFEVEFYGNPNSTHREGQEARARIDMARESVAKFLSAKPQEIVFTSGATEANNIAIQGVIAHCLQDLSVKPHVITTTLEHQSVYNTVKELEKRGVIDATYVKPSKYGVIDPQEVIKEITDSTVLISTIFVSNEIGSILPIREIGKLIAEVNFRQRHQIIYHIDAVQATKFFNCNVEKLGCDLLTISAHKVYGPKGIGALYVKTGTKINNLTYGGSQEYGRRPGTQNSVGIIGMAKAFELLGSLEDRQKVAENISKLRDELISEIKNISDSDLNGPQGESRTADNVNFTFYDVDQDALMTAVDLAGIAASTGSACVSGSSEPSHVIESLGKINDRQAATLRLTLGKTTTASEVNAVVKSLNEIIKQLR